MVISHIQIPIDQAQDEYIIYSLKHDYRYGTIIRTYYNVFFTDTLDAFQRLGRLAENYPGIILFMKRNGVFCTQAYNEGK